MNTHRIKNACSETLIIRLLQERPMHGYELCKEIESRSSGFFTFKHGTLYPLLHKLESDGLVTSQWAQFDSGKPRKTYTLTTKGSASHQDNILFFQELVSSLSMLLPEVAS